MNETTKEETLDPEDWETMRALGHRAIDDAVDFLASVRERPAWRAVPDEVAAHFQSPLPLEPEGAERAYTEFTETILPYPMGNVHPRFWAWYMGNGTFTGALGDFMAAIMNPNLGGGSHAAYKVEEQVLEWIKEIAGYPPEASGLLVSGGSMANLIGLAVARNVEAGFDVRAEGLHGSPKPMVVYGSTEVHSCNQKAAELLGLGGRGLREVAVNRDFTIDVSRLEEAIAEDRAHGRQPIAVIGSAGTVNTGAVDDLNALADLCEREGLWFHVDGAIGAVARVAPQNGHLLAGIERSDSVALDLHKWLHVPFEAGAVLVRNAEAHRRTFSAIPEYLEHTARGLAGGENWFNEYGPQLSRGFRALKVWLSFKEHGMRKFGRLIDQNIAQAQLLARTVRDHAELQMMAPVGLNIVCFRYCPSGGEEQDGADIEIDEVLNQLNQELLIRLHESGVAAPSYTTLHGHYCLRAALANHRTRVEDLQIFIDEVVKIGRELSAVTKHP